jgi:hypothetical protein
LPRAVTQALAERFGYIAKAIARDLQTLATDDRRSQRAFEKRVDDGGAGNRQPAVSSHLTSRHRSGCWYRRTPSPLVGLVPSELLVGRKRPVGGGQTFKGPCAGLPFARTSVRSTTSTMLNSSPALSPIFSISALGNRTARTLPISRPVWQPPSVARGLINRVAH